MGVGAFAEPLVVISLLVGGTLVNRARRNTTERSHVYWGQNKRQDFPSSVESGGSHGCNVSSERRQSSPYHLLQASHDGWRIRAINLFGLKKEVYSPDTSIFSERTLSRLLWRFPFLVEVWYWALIYWVYQLGRAFTALTLVEGTVHVARNHALQLVYLQQSLRIFWEPAIQGWFIRYPTMMHWINRIYSFIHIPGTILFLIWLYYATITSNRGSSPAGSALYQARRRTMAMCNLIAFVVFTAWPCMPPRLLSDPGYNGPRAEEAKSYGFVDTVHGAEGESSVWTTNRFCNQYAAMPSLHFGYSLLIGCTIATIPLDSDQRALPVWRTPRSTMRLSRATWKRIVCIVLGVAYPATILLAIVATANHFILDAVAGAVVCGVAWNAEPLLLNLLPLEDLFLWCLRMHKPLIETGSRE